MKKRIGITDDLADVFMVQALREGYCDYLNFTTKEKRNSYAEYIIHQNEFYECVKRFDDSITKVCDVASSAYLPHSGKSRLGCEAGTVMKFVFIPFVYCWRAGSC